MNPEIALRRQLALKSFWHAVLGILSELLLVAIIIVSGFVVCLAWWGLFR